MRIISYLFAAVAFICGFVGVIEAKSLMITACGVCSAVALLACGWSCASALCNIEAMLNQIALNTAKSDDSLSQTDMESGEVS